MNKIIYKDNFAFLYLTKNFYDKQAIFNSLEDYSDFLEYLYMDEENYHIIKISSKDEDYTLNNLVDEFLNYVVSEEYKVLGK
jgi:hypothetical protein